MSSGMLYDVASGPWSPMSHEDGNKHHEQGPAELGGEHVIGELDATEHVSLTSKLVDHS